MEDFVWQSVLDDIRKKYSDRGYEQFKNLKTVFDEKIRVLQSNVLSGVKPSSTKYGSILGPYILQWQQDLTTYVPALLAECCKRDKLKPLLFIDNVDQLAPEYQAQIFLLAQRVTRVLESVTIVSLREESYYTASIQKKFTAFTNHKFHIASPRFRVMIQSRIKYAVQLLAAQTPSDTDTLPEVDNKSISDFLLIVRDSIFGTNLHIVRFIEAICYGNMRFALQLFTTFLTSGATDVDKMLRIYNRDGQYHVAYHEFVKAIMLGDRRIYREDQSPIVNMFNVGGEKNSSHFTAWRLIDVLYARRGESTTEGRGYVPLSDVIGAFESVFNNRSDVLVTLDRLIRGQLIEANTRSTETLTGATHIRVTSAGIYYILVLAKSFAYLDLVLQDTPFNDPDVEAFLRDSCFNVDNLADREDLKLLRVRVRFERVDAFLNYLQLEERRERAEFGLDAMETIFQRPIVPAIQNHFESDRTWIDRRIIENRERYEDDTPIKYADEIVAGDRYDSTEEETTAPTESLPPGATENDTSK